MNNQAQVMTDVRKFELRDVEMPVIKPGEVGIAVKSVGVCGSDMGFYDGKAFSIFPDSLPFILGHECAGEVYSVGEGVTNLKVGDRVAVEPGVPCGKCEFCESGRYNLCPDVRFLATPPFGGCLMRYMSHPAHKVYKLEDNMSYVEGAMVEPLSVGISAVQRGRVSVGKTVAILGVGAIGMSTLLAAKAWGASRIIVSDLFDFHLEKALEIGATDAINSGKADAVEEILKRTDGKGADVVFETASSPVTVAQTAYIVKAGGTIVAVGNVMKEVPFSFRQLYRKEAEVRGLFRYHNTYPIAIQAISSGRLDAAAIVTDQFPFERAHEAFVKALDDKVRTIKCVINMD